VLGDWIGDQDRWRRLAIGFGGSATRARKVGGCWAISVRGEGISDVGGRGAGSDGDRFGGGA